MVIMVFYTFSAQELDTKKGIDFYQGSWQETLEIAKKENKLIFLDLYATWCGPCKSLKKNTFSNPEVGAFYNQNFINIALDGEQGDGPMLMRKYRLSNYPSLLFIDANGEVVGKAVGYHSPNEIIELAKKIQQK